MLSKSVKLASTATLLLGSSVALAIPFGSFDPRSMAMGGAGVAVGSASNAPLFNPALLSMTKEDDHFALVLPTIGIRVADPDKLIDSINKFQSGDSVNKLVKSVETLNTAITTANTTPTLDNIAAMQSAAGPVGTNLGLVSTQLNTLSNKPITIDGGVATLIAIPSDKMGAAFYATGTVSAGGLFLYKDAETLKTLVDHTICLSTAATPVDIITCGTNVNFTGTTLNSSINFRGVMLTEMGVVISTYNLGYMTWGITPKVVKATLYDVPINVNNLNNANNANQKEIDTKDYLATYSVPNLDIGIASYDNAGFRTGLVIKNIIPYTLDFKQAPTPGAAPVANGNTLSLKPQARIGVSHTNSWSTVALDYDVTRNDSAGFEKSTQHLAFGAELNAFDWVQLRTGYRIDMVDSGRNVTSVGLGLSPFGIPHIDIAVAGNESEVGASLQFGVHF